LREFPAIDRVSQKFAKGDVAILTINDDRLDMSRDKALAKINTSLPVLIDKDQQAVKAYQAYARPTLVVIDRQQEIYKVWTGEVDDIEDQLTASISHLLESGHKLQPPASDSSAQKAS